MFMGPPTQFSLDGMFNGLTLFKKKQNKNKKRGRTIVQKTYNRVMLMGLDCTRVMMKIIFLFYYVDMIVLINF